MNNRECRPGILRLACRGFDCPGCRGGAAKASEKVWKEDRVGDGHAERIRKDGAPDRPGDADGFSEDDADDDVEDGHDRADDDLEADEVESVEEHRQDMAAVAHDHPEAQSEEKAEGGVDHVADPIVEQERAEDDQGDRGCAHGQGGERDGADQGFLDPCEVAAGEGFGIGGPEGAGEESDEDGGDAEEFAGGRRIG